MCKRRFIDDPACDRITRIPARICFLIISAGMNNNCRTPWTNQRVIRRPQSKVGCSHLHIGRPIGTDFNVSQVTRVKSLGVFRSMLLCLWVEMLAS